MQKLPPDIAVILVDHGSRLDAANEMLLDVAKMYADVSATEIVEPAHMELAPPTIADALQRCVERGAKTVIIHPYFLFPGRHSTQDIPRMAAEAAQDFSNIVVKVTQPLNVDPAIGPVIQARILDCLNDA
jgi:sirohydrochlorin ferrochelatase